MTFDFDTLVKDAVRPNDAEQSPSTEIDVKDKADMLISEAGISTRIWDHPMPENLQHALDNVLTDLHEHHKAPRIEGKGSPMNVCTKVIENLNAAVSPKAKDDLQIVLDHIIAYICDYCEETGAGGLSIQFEFKRN